MRFFDRPDDVRRARQCLDEAGFGLDSLTERLGVHAFAHLGQGELAPLLRSTRGGDGLDTLLQLFVFGMPVPVAAARGRAAGTAPRGMGRWRSAHRRRRTRVQSDRHPPRGRPVGLVDRARLHPAARLGVARRSRPRDECIDTSPGGRDDPPRDHQRLRSRHRLRRAGAVRIRPRRSCRRLRSQPASRRLRHVDDGTERRHQRRRPAKAACSIRSRANDSI